MNISFEFGDLLETALSAVGVTQERVSIWLGRPCNCQERIDKLNQLSRWAKQTVNNRLKNAEQYLDQILEQE